jgi:hypothetical protein
MVLENSAPRANPDLRIEAWQDKTASSIMFCARLLARSLERAGRVAAVHRGKISDSPKPGPGVGVSRMDCSQLCTAQLLGQP